MENQRFLQRLDMAVLNLSTPFSLSLSLFCSFRPRREGRLDCDWAGNLFELMGFNPDPNRFC